MTSHNLSDLVEQLRNLFQGFDGITLTSKEVTEARAKAEDIFLDGATCPPGMSECDTTLRDCPDEEYSTKPSMYTTNGLRCYTDEYLEYTLNQVPKNAQVTIRDFVEQAAKLNAELQKQLKEINKRGCGVVTTQALCGVAKNCDWDPAGNAGKGSCDTAVAAI